MCTQCGHWLTILMQCTHVLFLYLFTERNNRRSKRYLVALCYTHGGLWCSAIYVPQKRHVFGVWNVSSTCVPHAKATTRRFQAQKTTVYSLENRAIEEGKKTHRNALTIHWKKYNSSVQPMTPSAALNAIHWNTEDVPCKTSPISARNSNRQKTTKN